MKKLSQFYKKVKKPIFYLDFYFLPHYNLFSSLDKILSLLKIKYKYPEHDLDETKLINNLKIKSSLIFTTYFDIWFSPIYYNP